MNGLPLLLHRRLYAFSSLFFNGVAPPVEGASWQDCRVETLAKERDRLLRQSISLIGSAFIIISYLSLFSSATGGINHNIPVVEESARLGLWHLVLLTALFGAMLASYFRLARQGPFVFAVGGIVAGLATLAVLHVAPTPDAHLAGVAVPLGGGGLAGFSIILLNERRRTAVALVTALAGMILVVLLTPGPDIARALLVMALSWLVIVFHYLWLSTTIPVAARRIYSIGRAHSVERQASEAEAQRRQSARLLHDTVLATLTLLAHSGVGVSPDTLRQQASDDAHLLRQLRLGGIPAPSRSGGYTLTPVEETPLGTTLESVKQRFGRMGLEVSWHGTGQVLLPSEVLDAFLLALAECLENVRRHSGVTEAHVTISVDDAMVRAMVTDAGIGFDIENVDEARLGLRESVIGRLGEVGGTARMFSAVGAGTTVVLEVPRG